ncbi:MAG TPA: YetF domain-containing protein [Methylosinus sp.]
MFFDSWSALWRTVVVGIAAYAALVLLLRISGKRTLAKLNAFDLIVTVALGSTLATVLLDKSVSLSDSLAAFLLLVGLQYVVAFLSVRSNRIDSLVKSEPSLLLLRGEFLDRTMRRQRVTHREILAALRSSGVANVEDAYAVVLESDGTLSVIPRNAKDEGARSALAGMERAIETATDVSRRRRRGDPNDMLS